mgnify:CR=1 FL=1
MDRLNCIILYLIISPLFLYGQEDTLRGVTPLNQSSYIKNTKAVIVGISDYKFIDNLN